MSIACLIYILTYNDHNGSDIDNDDSDGNNDCNCNNDCLLTLSFSIYILQCVTYEVLLIFYAQVIRGDKLDRLDTFCLCHIRVVAFGSRFLERDFTIGVIGRKHWWDF